MNTAIVLAAGSGKRMGTDVPKQFLIYRGEPLIVCSLRAFENSPKIDEIILVAAEDMIDYCREEIVEKYGLSKVKNVVAGGKERYESAIKGLEACPSADYVLIHDGARPKVTEEIIERVLDAAIEYGAAAVAMPAKETVKIADSDGIVIETPKRSGVWLMQTPQAFSAPLIKKANQIVIANGQIGDVTDDAMIVERSGLSRVKLVRGSYSNIKVTTPEDLAYLEHIDKYQSSLAGSSAKE